MTINVTLPELGDGIESGDVLQVLVSVGDTIDEGQGLVELETDKATVEVPSSHAGRITAVHVAEGQSIAIGAPLVSVDVVASDSAAPPQAAPLSGKGEAARAPASSEPSHPPPTLDTPSAPAPPTLDTPSAPAAGSPATAATQVAPAEPSVARPEIAAGPAVRRFAREVGVDLVGIVGTGDGGRVTRDDVLEIVRKSSRAAVTKGAVASARDPNLPGDPTSDAWGPVRHLPMTKIRKTIATRMRESWETVPRVTNFDDADVSELEHVRQSSKSDYAAKGIKLTAMPFIIKSVAMALRAHAEINAAIDIEAERIIYKDYVNIGVAVDTPRGLVVPSLRGADELSVPAIARGLAEIAERARASRFAIEDLRGSTFTISNLGSIGGTYSTPIINTPEVAVLLVGRSRKMPVVVDDQVIVRLMMPLSLSYDHRLVDGGAAARFLNEVIGYLEAPSRLLLAP